MATAESDKFITELEFVQSLANVGYLHREYVIHVS
jgi:hypothetical protein